MPRDFKESKGYREITEEDVKSGRPLGVLNASNQSDWLIVSMLRRGFRGAVKPLIDAKPKEERKAFMKWYRSLKEEDIPEGWR